MEDFKQTSGYGSKLYRKRNMSRNESSCQDFHLRGSNGRAAACVKWATSQYCKLCELSEKLREKIILTNYTYFLKPREWKQWDRKDYMTQSN